MNKISFVILHYLGIEDTRECIDSIIKNISYENYSIIVVDNGSNNGTGEKLIELYKNNSNIHVILEQNNLGFAKGNNIGFRFAKDILKSEFIIMINNDTIIEMNTFIDEIVNIYNETGFAVLGPDIISVQDNGHQNPQVVRANTKSKVLKQLVRHILLLIFNYMSIEGIVKFFMVKIKNASVENKNYNYLKECENIQLHGSCLIFSRKYIDKYDGLYDKTFMYFEEDILFFICQQEQLKTFYSPRIKILHKEDSATDLLITRSKIKRRFLYKNSIKSIIELYKLIN